MAHWTLENAQKHFAELVERALARQPQFIDDATGETVVVLARDEYERLAPPGRLAEFLRNSPAAKATAEGDLPDDAFERRRDLARDVDL